MATHYNVTRNGVTLRMNKKMYFFLRNSCVMLTHADREEESLHYFVHRKSGASLGARCLHGVWITTWGSMDELMRIGYVVSAKDKFSVIFHTTQENKEFQHMLGFNKTMKWVIEEKDAVAHFGITNEDVDSIELVTKE